MKTIYEHEVLDDFEEDDQQSVEDFIEAITDTAQLDLEDPWVKFPKKVLDAYFENDEELVKHVTVTNVDGADDDPQSKSGESAKGKISAEAIREHREEAEKLVRQKILKDFRYKVELDVQDLVKAPDDDFSSHSETWASRHKANERVMAIFQNDMVQARINMNNWVEYRPFAHANEICYFVDEDGCVHLGASRDNDTWNIRVRARRVR